MNLKSFIRFIKTYWIFEPFLFAINSLLLLTDLITCFLYRKPKQNGDKRLVIVKTDFIGDYFFFRNFIEEIRKDEKFKDYHITLFGNRLWKNIFEEFDSEFVDEVIWFDIYKLSTNLSYRYTKMKEFIANQYEIAFNPLFNRVHVVDDYIMRSINAKQKIGQQTDTYNIKRWEMWIGDRFYTDLVDGGNNLFDFYKNKKAVEYLLGHSSATHQMILKVKNELTLNKYDYPFVVMVPGAGDAFRQWKPHKFAVVAEYVLKNTDWIILLSGSPAEHEIAQEIVRLCGSDRVINRTKDLPLNELIHALSKAKMLISNDSSAIPMAVSLGLKTLCVANGKHFGRFTPYPQELSPNLKTLYPPSMRHYLKTPEKLYKINKINSRFDINEIEPQEVIDSITSWIPT